VLIDAAKQHAAGARALDVGAGAGVFSVWLAQQGFRTTGIDLFPQATEMARARARAQGVQVDFLTSDLFSFTPAERFDLVFDSGCLHSLVGGDVRAYKRKLLSWLAPGGDYVLEHWGKRHPLDIRPVGPRRRSERAICALFSPELTLRRSDVNDFEVPFPFGPVVRGVGYWFRRSG
jgi:cyclopropane fatty-acyl-phospholipid synthase-like methyltransferase